MDIRRVTNGPKHHLFGFHDLIAFNNSGEKLLSLEVEQINRPPISGEKIGAGYVNWQESEFVELGKTNAFNYPQGARQQWLDNSHFVVNNQVGQKWGADIYDVDDKLLVTSLTSPVHCISKDSKYAFGINYARLHRLGGYGYIGIKDEFALEAKPVGDGIYKTEIATDSTQLIVSISDVANCDVSSSVDNGLHHFITHLVLSPNGQRIAFLHRCFLLDGGVRTRLMTVGVNGENLRCLAHGFLSHFDWRDDSSIFIWGRSGSSIDAIRSNPLLSNPILSPIMGVAKRALRGVLRKNKGMVMNFLLVRDSDPKDIAPFGQGVLCCDGHPMCSPLDRNIMICDTYPDSDRNRTLFTYDFLKNERNVLGVFRMIDDLPDTTRINEYTEGIDKLVLSMMSDKVFSFSRSGLHCDLHPRWNADGTMVAFDSIHEGSRQIYACKI